MPANKNEPEELREYEYTHAGGTYTAMLSEKHARRYKDAKPTGATVPENPPVPLTGAQKIAQQEQQESTAETPADSTLVTSKARTTAQNK